MKRGWAPSKLQQSKSPKGAGKPTASYRIVMKEVYGQKVPVKVYEPHTRAKDKGPSELVAFLAEHDAELARFRAARNEKRRKSKTVYRPVRSSETNGNPSAT